jgi:hypothetical protein
VSHEWSNASASDTQPIVRHLDLDGAKDQAAFEYGEAIRWAEIAPTEEDVVTWLQQTFGKSI